MAEGETTDSVKKEIIYAYIKSSIYADANGYNMYSTKMENIMLGITNLIDEYCTHFKTSKSKYMNDVVYKTLQTYVLQFLQQTPKSSLNVMKVIFDDNNPYLKTPRKGNKSLKYFFEDLTGQQILAWAKQNNINLDIHQDDTTLPDF